MQGLELEQLELLRITGQYNFHCPYIFISPPVDPAKCIIASKLRFYGRFGPAGDPRGAGIGTPEAIKLVWSCHREIIYDFGPLSKNWETPPST